MADSRFYQLGSPEFSQQLQILCHKAKKRKKWKQKPIHNWHGKENFEFSEYRSYTPGDDLRKVDWNIYQRLQEVMIKEYEIEPPKHLVVVLDISKSMSFQEKFQYSKALAAILVYIGSTILDKVTFLHFPSSCNPQSFSSNKGMLRFFDHLQKITTQDPDSNHQNFLHSQVLRSHQVNCIIISDFYNEENFTSLHLLRAATTVVQVVAKEEIQPTLEGYLCLEDAETSKKKKIFVDKERWKIYSNNFHEHLQKVKTYCRQSKVNYFLAEEKEDFSSVLNILQLSGIIK